MATSFLNNSNLPRGLRDNNPGNVRPNPNYTWYGAQGIENNYVIFDDIEHGIRAMAKDIKSKINRGLDTISKYIAVYAPPADGNNTQGYIDRVSQLSGINEDATLLVSIPTLFKLVKAQINVEIGAHYAGMITDEMITTGVSMAF